MTLLHALKSTSVTVEQITSENECFYARWNKQQGRSKGMVILYEIKDSASRRKYQ
jgi:hypothetical protein